MRGVLTELPGVATVDVQPGNPEIVVAYDPETTDVEAVLAGMKAGGQPAKRK